jgi:hypothetical protein
MDQMEQRVPQAQQVLLEPKAIQVMLEQRVPQAQLEQQAQLEVKDQLVLQGQQVKALSLPRHTLVYQH